MTDVVPTGADSNNRYPRVSQAPGITGLRLSPYGADATLVNISASGVLAECALRLKVDSAVQVVFEGEFAVKSAAGRITRCEVAGMGSDGLIRYHVGIAFNEPIPFDAPAAAAGAAAAPVEPPSPPQPTPTPVVRPHTSPAQPVLRNQW